MVRLAVRRSLEHLRRAGVPSPPGDTPNREHGNRRDAQSLHVIIWDDARGQEEGREAEALVGVFPADLADGAVLQSLGFARAASAFMGTFDPGGRERAAVTSKRYWCVRNVRASVWVAVLSREDWPGTHVPREAVLPVLSDWSTQLSRVLLMLLGPLPEFLTDADDAGRAALCQAAQRVLRVLAGDLAAPPRSPAGASVRSAFVARAAAPAARLTDRAALAAQSLVACAVENDVVSVAAAAAFAPDGVAATTLAPQDTSAMHALLHHARLLPPASPAGAPRASASSAAPNTLAGAFQRLLQPPTPRRATGPSPSPNVAPSAPSPAPLQPGPSTPAGVPKPRPATRTLARPDDAVRPEAWVRCDAGRGAVQAAVLSGTCATVDVTGEAAGWGRQGPEGDGGGNGAPGGSDKSHADVLLPHLWLGIGGPGAADPGSSGVAESSTSAVPGVPVTMACFQAHPVILVFLMHGHVSVDARTLVALARALSPGQLDDTAAAMRGGGGGGLAPETADRAMVVHGDAATCRSAGRASASVGASDAASDTAAHAMACSVRAWASDVRARVGPDAPNADVAALARASGSAGVAPWVAGTVWAGRGVGRREALVQLPRGLRGASDARDAAMEAAGQLSAAQPLSSGATGG